MNFLFWNTNKNKVNNILKDIIIENNCDIVVLAEYEDNINSLLYSLDENDVDMYNFTMIACERIILLTRFKQSLIKRFSDDKHYVILQIPHKNIEIKNILMASVHLPSKLKADNTDLLFKMNDLINDLEKDEQISGCDNTIILGDFNLNPFEEPMIAARCAHALSCKIVARRKHRKIQKQKYKMLYNPMWNLFGDNEGVPGTYYYQSPGQKSYYWNIFDQVIIRPELINFFENDSLKIITKTEKISLIKKRNKRPNEKISDHLPIFFTIS